MREVAALRPSGTGRSEWSSTSWLLLLLCISLLGWRYSSRLEQYRPSATGPSATVSTFDANERNYESARATRLQSRALSEERDRIGCFGRPELLIQIISRRPPDRPAVPRYTLAYSVSLFSNPPPSFA